MLQRIQRISAAICTSTWVRTNHQRITLITQVRVKPLFSDTDIRQPEGFSTPVLKLVLQDARGVAAMINAQGENADTGNTAISYADLIVFFGISDIPATCNLNSL